MERRWLLRVFCMGPRIYNSVRKNGAGMCSWWWSIGLIILRLFIQVPSLLRGFSKRSKKECVYSQVPGLLGTAGINVVFLWAVETQSLVQVEKVRGEVTVSIALRHCYHFQQNYKKDFLRGVQMIFRYINQLMYGSFPVTCYAGPSEKDLHCMLTGMEPHLWPSETLIRSCPLQQRCSIWTSKQKRKGI